MTDRWWFLGRTGKRWVPALAAALVLGCHSSPRAQTATRSQGEETRNAVLSLKEVFGDASAEGRAAQTRPTTRPRLNSEAVLAFFQAKAALLEKDQKQTVVLLRKAVALDETYLPARALLMQVYFELGQSEAAAGQARKVLALDPDDAMANYILGSTLLKQDDFSGGSRHLYLAMRLWNKPDQVPVLDGVLAAFRLGGALADKGYLNAALEVYQPLVVQMERIEGDETIQDLRLKRIVQLYRPGLYLLIGEFNLKLGRFAPALDAFGKGAQIPAIRNSAQMGIVRANVGLGKRAEAGTLLESLARDAGFDDQVLDLYRQVYPEDEWPLKAAEVYRADARNLSSGLLLVEELKKRSRNQPAMTVLRKILAIDPSNAQAFGLLVGLSGQSNMDEAAGILFEAVVQADAKSAMVPAALRAIDPAAGRNLSKAVGRITAAPATAYAKEFLLALARQMAGDFSGAEAGYKASLKGKPNFLSGYLAYGQLLLGQYRWADAEALMKEAQGRGVDTGGILYVQGVARMEQGDIPGALAALNAAVKANPDSDSVVLALAETYLRSSEPGKAFEYLKQMIGNNLTGPATVGRLVQLLLEADSLPLAESVLDQYARRYGADDEYRLLLAKLRYLKDPDPREFRTMLTRARERGYRSGTLDRLAVELEFDEGQYAEVIRRVQEALKSNPLLGPRDYQRLRQLEAFAYWKRLEYDQSERVWLALLRIWPRQSALQSGLARMYIDAQEYGKAEPVVAALLKAETNPEQVAQLQLWFITCLTGQEKYDEAVRTVEAWIASAEAPDEARLRGLKVDCLVRAKRNVEAVVFLEGLVNTKQRPVLEWQRLVISTLSDMGDSETALKKVDGYIAAAEAKNRHFLEGQKVSVLLRLKRYPEAVALAEKRVSAASEEQRFASVLVLISAYQKSGRFAQAIDRATREAEKYASNSAFGFALRQQVVRSYELAGKTDQAEAYAINQIKKASATEKNQWQQVLTSVYFSSGKSTAAVRLLEDILAADPREGWANNSLGYALADSGKDLIRAEQLIRTALATDPGNASYLDSLAWVLYRQGRYEQALRFARMAYRGMAQADPVVLDHLGDIYWKLQNVEEARSFWTQSVAACRDRDSGSLEPDMPGRTLRKLSLLPKGSTQPFLP